MVRPMRFPDPRSQKRQRLPSVDEDESDDSFLASLGEEEEDSESESQSSGAANVEEEVEEQEVEEEDIGGTRMGTIGIDNHSEDVTRSVSSSPSSSSTQTQSVKLKSSDVLDCPTCCEPLKRPIYQCTNGHLACSSCCTKLRKRCPFCRSHIGDIRCRAMEKIIESSIVPCRNAVHGCQQTTSYDKQSSHEKLCVFIRCSCPLPNCNYTGSYKDLQSHALANHTSADLWDEDLIQFSFDTPLIFGLDVTKKKMRVFQEKKEGDLIVVQSFKGLHGVSVTVSSIAPMAPQVRSLSCSLAKLSSHTTLRLGFKLKKIQKVNEQEEPKDGFMFIPSYMLSNDHLKMQICIGSEYKYVHI